MGRLHVNDTDHEFPEAALLSVRRLAQVLDCSPKTLHDWLYKERKTPTTDPLPYYRLGGLVRFRLSEVLHWIERRRVRVSSLSKLVE